MSNKTGNPKKPQKIIVAAGKLLNLCAQSWWGFAEGVIQFVLFTILWFKWSVKKHFVAKVLVAIWEIFSHENDRNYNSYRFSYKFVFVLSYKPKTTRIWISESWWSDNEKYFCFLFIASHALLQSHAEFNIFLHVIPFRIIVPCFI